MSFLAAAKYETVILDHFIWSSTRSEIDKVFDLSFWPPLTEKSYPSSEGFRVWKFAIAK
jgi:hypothetical protein